MHLRQGLVGREPLLCREHLHGVPRRRGRLRRDIELALDAATTGGARALGLTSYGVVVGAPADAVVVRAGSPAEAVVTGPTLLLKAGRVVARDGSSTSGAVPGIRTSTLPAQGPAALLCPQPTTRESAAAD